MMFDEEEDLESDTGPSGIGMNKFPANLPRQSTNDVKTPT